MPEEMKADNPVLAEQLQNFKGPIRLVTGEFKSPADSIIGTRGWSMNADGTHRLFPAMIEAVGRTVSHSSFSGAFNGDWTRFVTSGYSTVNYEVASNPNGSGAEAFLSVASNNVFSGTPLFCWDPGTSKFYAAENGSTSVRRYNDDDTLSGEQAMSFSGTAVVAGYGIASDGDFLYVADNDGGTKKVRKYSVSGTVLTHVSSTTLADNNSNLGLAVLGGFWYLNDTTNHLIRKYTSAGAASATKWNGDIAGNWFAGCPMRDPDGYLRIVGYMNTAATYYRTLAARINIF